MKEIHILGTAPSVQSYKPNGSETIGVNDIFKYHTVDNLLLLDKQISFTPERLRIITESKPKQVYSTLSEWNKIFPKMKKISLCDNPGDVSGIDSDKYIYHCDSTFTAVHLAYKKDAKIIKMYGVDFTGDKWNSKKYAILSAYSDLYIKLRERGITLFIANQNSLLAQILPII